MNDNAKPASGCTGPSDCSASTDRELWRAVPDDYYAPSVFVTREGDIGMNHGGTVFVMTVEEWVKRAKAFISPNEELTLRNGAKRNGGSV